MPAELIGRYGTKASCEAAEAAQCLLWVDASDSTQAAGVSATIRAEMIGLATCADLAALDGYAGVPGQRAVGASCQRYEQCASGYCELPADGFCGTCQPAPVLADHAGEPCQISESRIGCATPGLVCDLPSKTCAAPPGLGDACVQTESQPSPYDWCGSKLICVAGKCVAPLFYGDACTTSEDHCSALAGLVCNANGTCDLATPLHVEGRCGGAPSVGTCGLADRCESNGQPALDDIPGVCAPDTTGYGDACARDLDCPSALTCLQQPGAGGGSSGVCGARPLIDHHCD